MELDIGIDCGSPSGMGQLIKYFESQNRRLDRQSAHTQPLGLNSDFESLIKFNGVPILPPVITSSRRDELKQYKKDAILLEKRIKARQRRQLLDKADHLVAESQATFMDSGCRPAARQLNFDSGGHGGQEEEPESSLLKDRLGATNPLSTFATAETGIEGEDFGLQTMDTLNSDFMSLEEGLIPTVFSGLSLNSYKEQKISYDLDRLSKVLNIQELNSTSGSGVSDELVQTQTWEDDQNPEKWAEKVLAHKMHADCGDVNSASFFHESQDTVVEVSQDHGGQANSADNTSTSGFGDHPGSALEQTQTSLGSSPGCGSASTTGTVDSQKSNRSSPKSLKNAVHFSSFVTEYTSASQSMESTTIVKKKLSSDGASSRGVVDKTVESEPVLPIIVDPFEARQRSKKPSDGVSGAEMLGRVSLNPDSDSSPNTPPFNPAEEVPFLNYSRAEAYSSDKENNVSQNPTTSPHAPKKLSNKTDHLSQHQISMADSSDQHPHGGRPKRRYELDKYGSPLSNDGNKDNSKSFNITSGISVHSHGVSGGVGIMESQAVSHTSSVGASQASITDSADLVSISQVSLRIPTGVVSAGQMSISDSQGSAKSNPLTALSGSSSSTIKDDLSTKGSSNLAMNIVDMGQGSVSQHVDGEQLDAVPATKESDNLQVCSPKKLNTDTAECDIVQTPPPRSLVRRGSYTLSEPSPALVQAQFKVEAEQREIAAQQMKTRTETAKTEASPQSAENNLADTRKKLQFHGVDEPPALKQAIDNIVPSEIEKEGKAEHINKYLNQVQFQNSMNLNSQSWDLPLTSDALTTEEEFAGVEDEQEVDILDIVRSLAESRGSQQIDGEQLVMLHQNHMEQAKQELIQRQQMEMEELFVQQRRAAMLLAAEIKAAQLQGQGQQEFLLQNAPENIKVKARGLDEEYSPEHTGNYDNTDKDVNKEDLNRSAGESSIDSMNNRRPRSYHRSSLGSHSTVPSLQLKSYPGNNPKSDNSAHVKNGPNRRKGGEKNNTPSDVLHDEHQTRVKTVSPNESFSPRAVPPEFNSSSHSPRFQKNSLVRSPLKQPSLPRRNQCVVVPPKAYLPEMQVKFDRVSAVAKGFLTRSLLRSDKVQELIKTIKDTREFAFNFQTETPIKRGVYTSQDRALLERIIAQLQAALLDIHEIFFELPSSERLALIEQARMKEYGKRVRASKDSMKGSGPRISQATLKALERKRKAQEAEASALLSTPRPRTAPPTSSSPRCQNHTDISGPLRRHFGFLISRALKPLQFHDQTQVSPIRPETSRSEKDRPRTAPEKQLTRPKRITAPSYIKTNSASQANKDAHKDGSIGSRVTSKLNSGVTSKPVIKSKVAPSKSSSSQPTKSWR